MANARAVYRERPTQPEIDRWGDRHAVPVPDEFSDVARLDQALSA